MTLEKISDYFWFQEGPGVRNYQYTSSGVKLLNVSNFVNGKLVLSNSERFIAEEEAYGRYKHFLVDPGDLLIASSGIKVDYFHEKMAFASENDLPLCMNTSTIRFKSRDCNKANSHYLMYYLKSPNFMLQLTRFITGSAQLNFGPSHLNKMVFPLISIDDQIHVVDIFSKLDSVLSKIEKELSLYDNLTKSQFIATFGDMECNSNNYPISCLGNLFDIGSSKRVYEKDWKTEGVPFYRAREVVKLSEDGFVNNSLFISAEMYSEYSKKYGVPQPGDILCTGVGTLGICYLVQPNDKFYYKDGNIICFHNKGLFNSRFLVECFKMPFIKNQIRSISSGSTVGTYTIVNACKTKIPVPPLDIQNSFEQFLNQIDKSKFRLKELQSKLETLYKSLLQKYFVF